MFIQRTRFLHLRTKCLWRGIIARAHSEWGYRKGIVPEQWHTAFPLCSGKNQSPIDIKTADVVYDPSLKNFNLEQLQTSRDLMMVLCTNHGRSGRPYSVIKDVVAQLCDVLVEIHMDFPKVLFLPIQGLPLIQVDLKGENIQVTGGSLPGTYIVEQFHFHWGVNDNTGSEHTIDGRGFSSELHVVMHLDIYKNSGEALSKTNGLAVLGYLIEVGNHNENYDKIFTQLKTIKHRDDSIILPSFQLTSLLPSTNGYYRYYGSQTTPPCASVIWTMFKERINLSNTQLKEFRKLGDTYLPDMDLIHNCREPQPLDGRTVTTNCKDN